VNIPLISGSCGTDRSVRNDRSAASERRIRGWGATDPWRIFHRTLANVPPIARWYVSDQALGFVELLLPLARAASTPASLDFLRPVVERARAIVTALIGAQRHAAVPGPRTGRRHPGVAVAGSARVAWDGDSWFLATPDGARVCSFDLADRVFARRAEVDGALRHAVIRSGDGVVRCLRSAR
jgi:hypothetical protein